MGVVDYFTWLLRNMYVGQEATVRTGHVTADWFRIRKGVWQGCILSPCLLNLYVEYTRNAGMCWTIRKSECQRIDAFELWCWRRLLRAPLTARRSNQSILKEIRPEYPWENWCWSWSSINFDTWCKELIHWKRHWCWERLKAKGEGGSRG